MLGHWLIQPVATDVEAGKLRVDDVDIQAHDEANNGLGEVALVFEVNGQTSDPWDYRYG